MTELGARDLAELDAAIDRALASGDQTTLDVLGYGEITSVVAWRGWACKRLPLFRDRDAIDTYRAVFDAYVGALRHHDVIPVDTVLREHARDDGMVSVFCVQPALPAAALAPAALADADAATAERQLGDIIHRIFECVCPAVGLDGQLSNWAWLDGELRYLDLTTPLLRDPTGASLLDTDLFLASLPWALRGAIKRFALPGILDRYHDPRQVAMDLTANLLKERLEKFAPLAIDLANRRLHNDPIHLSDVRRYYRSDARFWAGLQLLRRADRGWQRRVRRRVYPFLLPGRIQR